MKIGIDALSLQLPNQRAGLYRYSERLVANLQELDQANEYTLIYHNWRSPTVERLIRELPLTTNFRRRICRVPFRVVRALDPMGVSAARLLGRYDVFHGPSFRLVPGSCYRRSVVSVHDLRFFTLPGTFAQAAGARQFAAEAEEAVTLTDLVVANSEYTKAALLEHFRLSEARVRVIHPGVEETFRKVESSSLDEVRAKYDLRGPFVLTVGFLEEKKNHKTLVRAFSELRKAKGKDFRLVIAGQWGPAGPDLLRLARELSISDALTLTGYVPQEDLPALYSAASAFAFPSLHEGFGIPPLEAMAACTPVVSSSAAALSETLGDAALFIDPLDASALADALAEVLTNERLRESLIARGRARASCFSWRRMAQTFLDLYRELDRERS